MTTRTFPLSAPINLNARLGHGSVVVTAQDDLAEARVTLIPRTADSGVVDRITVELNGPTLSVLAPRQGGVTDLFNVGRRERDGVDVEIAVPSGTAMKIATFTADITVRGRCGSADLATGAATITVDDVDGDLRLRSGSASSRVRTVRGSVVVRSASGDADFGEIAGSLQAGFGSGDLDVGIVHGEVRSRAGSGEARLGTVHGDVDLAAGSGDVSIGLPAGVSARLEVKTGSGRVRSELPIEDDRKGTGRAISLRARTGSGDVRLFRAGGPPAA
ncbi:MAG: DUF4097 domain-containing protein [Actinomycetota bacterium]|nr:DUF4097 domain-containing protein [Actinomycetota bacterium]